MPHTYPHMCRDGHEEIGFSNSEIELCPLCLVKMKAELVEAEMLEAKSQIKELLVIGARLERALGG